MRKTFKNVKNPAMNFITAIENEPIDGVVYIIPAEIKKYDVFEQLFPIREDVYQAILESMKTDGFDNSQPLIIWREKDVLLDGHTRLKAVIEAGIKEVPVIYVSIDNEEAALEYLYRLQFNRRNIKDSELIILAGKALEKYVKQYGKGGKAEFLAKRFTGLSTGKAKQIIVILDKATEEQLQGLREEKITINALYVQVKDYEISIDEFASTSKLNETKQVLNKLEAVETQIDLQDAFDSNLNLERVEELADISDIEASYTDIDFTYTDGDRTDLLVNAEKPEGYPTNDELGHANPEQYRLCMLKYDKHPDLCSPEELIYINDCMVGQKTDCHSCRKDGNQCDKAVNNNYICKNYGVTALELTKEPEKTEWQPEPEIIVSGKILKKQVNITIERNTLYYNDITLLSVFNDYSRNEKFMEYLVDAIDKYFNK